MMSGLKPFATSVRMTPICAKPRAAPPPSASAIVGRFDTVSIRHVDYGPVPARSATAQEMKHRSAPLAMLNALRRTRKCFAPVW